jgi:glycosyltransferase involved in cell wall biosynthesis
LDVIHCHGDAIEAAIVTTVARRLGIPVVLTIHGGLSSKLLYRRTAPGLLLKPRHVVAVSSEIKRQLEHLGIPGQRVSVISSGVDCRGFSESVGSKRDLRAKLGLSLGRVVLLSVGRLHPVKGFEYLIEAVGKVNEVIPTELIVIGEGSQRPMLERLVRGENVRLVGLQPRERVVEFLQACDIFVLASVDLATQSEGTPTALIEAMSAGLPVIVSDSGDCRPLMEASGGGIVVPQRDVMSLAEAIEQLASHPVLRREMGESNRRAARSKDWALVAREVSHVYEKVRTRPISMGGRR